MTVFIVRLWFRSSPVLVPALKPGVPLRRFWEGMTGICISLPAAPDMEPVQRRKLLALHGCRRRCEMEVALNHCQGRVSQVLLKQKDIPPVKQEHRRIGVPQEVRVQPPDLREFGQPLENGSDGIWRQWVPVLGQEVGIHVRVGGFGPPGVLVVQEGLHGGVAEGDDPLLGALTHDLQIPVGQVHVLVLEARHLHDPKARVQHQGDDGGVAGALMDVALNCPKDGGYLLGVQGFDNQLGVMLNSKSSNCLLQL